MTAEDAFAQIRSAALEVQHAIERLDEAQGRYHAVDAAESGVHDPALRDALHGLIEPLLRSQSEYASHLEDLRPGVFESGVRDLASEASPDADRSVIAEAQALFGRDGKRVVGLRQTQDGSYALMFLDMHSPEAIGRGTTPEEALEDAKRRDGALYRRRVAFKPKTPLGTFGRLMDSLKTYGVAVEADDSTNERLVLHTTARRYDVDSLIRITRAGKYVDEVTEI